VAEIDRLAPLARTDADALAQHEYSPEMTDQLVAYRTRLSTESGAKDEYRNAAKAAGVTERAAITEGKNVLRSGVATATNALAARVPPEGETPEITRGVVNDLSTKIGALVSGVGRDSAKLRARLGALKIVLEDPAIATSAPAQIESRRALIAKIDHAVAALPTHAETTKERRQDAKTSADDLDEIDGRAYFNLKLLCKTGRAYFLENGNPTRAAAYQLNNLHAKARKPRAPTETGSGTGGS